MKRLVSAVLAATLAASIAAFAANTVFFTSLGDIVFPFSPPTQAGAAGAIDNMVIGATTPRGGKFTTLESTGGVAPVTGLTISPRLVMSGNWKPLAITDGTSVTCVVTTTYIAEIFIPANMTLTGVSVVNAAAVAGNVQVGLADSTGAPIAAALSASTAASGTAAYQRIPFAAPFAAKGPATYYVQLQCNNTGYAFRAHTVGDFGAQSQTSGVFGTFASFVPAATFTTAVGPVLSLY